MRNPQFLGNDAHVFSGRLSGYETTSSADPACIHPLIGIPYKSRWNSRKRFQPPLGSCIIDLCHKHNSDSSNQISERNFFVTSLQITRTVRESRGKRSMASTAKRVTLAAEEAARKLGFEDAKVCQLEVIAGVRDVFGILVSAKQTCGC